MTHTGPSRDEAPRNLPEHRGRIHEGNGNLDAPSLTATRFLHGNSLVLEATEPGEVVNYAAMLRKLWRRKLLIVSTFLVGTSAAVAVVLHLPVHYVAHAFLVIGDQHAKNHPSYTSAGGGPSFLPDTRAVQTEVEVLKSPQLAIEVIQDLKLQENPEFNPAVAPVRQPAVLPWIKEWLFGPPPPSNPQAQAAAELSQTIDNFLGRLRITIKENSRMVDIAFDSSDARLAMQVANAMADHYIANQLESRLTSAQQISAWLQQRIAKLQTKVVNAERAIEDFRAKAGLFSTPGGAPLILKQMTDVSADLANAQTVRAAIEARLSQLRATSQPTGRANPTSDLIDSPLMKTLDGQEAEVQQKLGEALATLGERHPTTIGLRQRLRHVQAAKHNESSRITASLENDLKIAQMKERDLSSRLDRLQAQVMEMNRSEVKLRALEREAQADRLVLNNIIGRFKEVGHEGESPSQRPDAQIVSYARLPTSPDRPQKGLLIAIAGVVSLIGGGLLALMVERSDRTLRSLADVEGTLRIAGLGMLPSCKAAQLSPSEAARYGSSYREAAKAIYSRIFCTARAPKVTVVTSALPGEGKSTLALSLAAMAAQSGQRVLFANADFWKRGTGATLGIRSRAGLAELLEGKARLSDAIMSDVASGADVIAPGTFSRASLLAWAGKLPELFASLRDRYDVIIVDAPPVLSVSEAALLAGHADATVMAIRYASTPWDVARIAVKRLHDAGAAVSGAILTLAPEDQHASDYYAEGAYISKSPVVSPPSAAAIARSMGLQHSGKRIEPAFLNGEASSPRAALLVLDVQAALTHSLEPHLPSAQDCDRLIETINSLSQTASKFRIMVIHAERERRHFVAKPILRVLAKETGRPAGATSSDKRLTLAPAYSFVRQDRDAFADSDLGEILRKYGISHLFLAGLDGATSIAQTARSALDEGYRVTFVQDCIFTAFESRWQRLLKEFESDAAFPITSEEFAEFAAAVHKASETQRRPRNDRAGPRRS